jgi:hypothetical protein
VDPEEKAGRARERALTARERLRFRVYSAVRDVVLGTELFRSHPELHEPEIFVNVYAQLVDVNACLSEGQLRLLREKTGAKGLSRFAEELRIGIGEAAAGLRLEFTTNPVQFGGSQPVILLDTASGYRAVLLRPEPE